MRGQLVEQLRPFVVQVGFPDLRFPILDDVVGVAGLALVDNLLAPGYRHAFQTLNRVIAWLKSMAVLPQEIEKATPFLE
jgi:hypothetical protein